MPMNAPSGTSSSITVPIPTPASWFDDIGNFSGNVTSIIEFAKLVIFITAIFFVVVFIVFFWRRKINKVTLQKINIFKRNGKYIDGIFVELDGTKELLRYYLNGLNWKRKVIFQYNNLFNTYAGKFAKENILANLKFKISRHASLLNLKSCIESMYDFVKNIRKGSKDEKFQNDTGDLSYYIEHSFYKYDDFLLEFKNQIEMITAKHILILGSAGNGKTNLLCNFTETVIKYGHPCVFINAKEIKGNWEEMLSKELFVPIILSKKIGVQVFLKLYSLLMWFRRKNLYIVIDAINENDNADFRKSMELIFEVLGNYTRIKLLVSCRSEYYDERFKAIFDRLETPFYCMQIDEGNYEIRAKEKILVNYQNYFNVNGNIIGAAKEKIFRSLLLMRIFFEVNRGNTVNALELRNAEIYKRYIEKISEKAKEQDVSFDFEKILIKITNSMLINNDYDGVEINDLNIDAKTLHTLKYILDENLIISRKTKTGIGITEIENDTIYFVFDELRDFCITRYILIKCDGENETNYRELFELLSKLNNEKQSPLEGVLKYAYYYLKNQSTHPDRLSFCKKILDDYGQAVKHEPWNNKDTIFDNFGILMVLSDCSFLEDFELEYIIKSMRKISDFWNLLNMLFDNEVAEIGIYTNVFLIVLLSHEIEDVKKILNIMIKQSDFNNDDSTSLVEFCYKVLQQKEISEEIKWILLLMNGICHWSENIEKCFEKFKISTFDKQKFIEWLSGKNYPNTADISQLIEYMGGAI